MSENIMLLFIYYIETNDLYSVIILKYTIINMTYTSYSVMSLNTLHQILVFIHFKNYYLTFVFLSFKWAR